MDRVIVEHGDERWLVKGCEHIHFSTFCTPCEYTPYVSFDVDKAHINTPIERIQKCDKDALIAKLKDSLQGITDTLGIVLDYDTAPDHIKTSLMLKRDEAVAILMDVCGKEKTV